MAARDVQRVFKPQVQNTYEIGFKSRLLDNKLQLNLAGFYYDYSNQVFQDLTCINLDSTQTPPVCNGYSLVNRNIGASRIYGAEAAAHRWYGKSAADLTPREAARLAAILPSPRRYQAASPGPYVRRRAGRIQAAMGTVRGEGLAACVLR